LIASSLFHPTGNTLTVASAYRALSFFNLLRWTLIQLPQSLANITTGSVSVKRIETLLMRAELVDPAEEDEALAKDAHAQVSRR
jgi:hypothetical protein